VFTILNGETIYVPVLNPPPAMYQVLPSTRSDGKTRGRFYFFHEMVFVPPGFPLGPLNNGPFNIECYLQLANSLTADGWQVVVCGQPEDVVPWGPGQSGPWSGGTHPIYYDIRDDPGAGSRYLATWLASFDNTKAQVEGAHGALPSGVFGLSWGGWGALTTAANRSGELISAIAGVPPIPLNQVVANGGTLFPFATSGYDLIQAQMNAMAIPSFVYWGVQDQTTVPVNTGAMFNAAIQAGATFATRSVTDGVITGGTSFSSATACLQTNETGAVITGPGIPAGTTITVTNANDIAGPYTATLSQACTNGSGLACSFPGLAVATTDGHSMVSATATLISNWVAATLDQHYPAVN
jgi:hypothetical protein